MGTQPLAQTTHPHPSQPPPNVPRGRVSPLHPLISSATGRRHPARGLWPRPIARGREPARASHATQDAGCPSRSRATPSGGRADASITARHQGSTNPHLRVKHNSVELNGANGPEEDIPIPHGGVNPASLRRTQPRLVGIQGYRLVCKRATGGCSGVPNNHRAPTPASP